MATINTFTINDQRYVKPFPLPAKWDNKAHNNYLSWRVYQISIWAENGDDDGNHTTNRNLVRFLNARFGQNWYTQIEYPYNAVYYADMPDDVETYVNRGDHIAQYTSDRAATKPNFEYYAATPRAYQAIVDHYYRHYVHKVRSECLVRSQMFGKGNAFGRMTKAEESYLVSRFIGVYVVDQS